MKKLWLIFAQTVTISLAVVFVVQIFYPKLIYSNIQYLEDHIAKAPQPTKGFGSYSDAAQKAMPSVVNIFTSKKNATNPHHLGAVH